MKKPESHVPSDWLFMESALNRGSGFFMTAFFPLWRHLSYGEYRASCSTRDSPTKDPHSPVCRGDPCCPASCFSAGSASSKFQTLVWAEAGNRHLDLERETGIAPAVPSIRLEPGLWATDESSVLYQVPKPLPRTCSLLQGSDGAASLLLWVQNPSYWESTYSRMTKPKHFEQLASPATCVPQEMPLTALSGYLKAGAGKGTSSSRAAVVFS